jgi:hypothetical protein
VQQSCRPPEFTFHWPGTQLPKTVLPNYGDRYTMVRGDAGAFRVELGCAVSIGAMTRDE